VVPSIPGYGFSEGPKKPGFKLSCVAETYDKLMKRLGYKHYGGYPVVLRNPRFMVVAALEIVGQLGGESIAFREYPVSRPGRADTGPQEHWPIC